MNHALLNDFRRLSPQTHIMGFYKTADERMEILSAYYATGLENKELCIFVTAQKPDPLIKRLKHYGLDITDAVEEERFHIFPTEETYIPNGEFKASSMLENLRNFVEQGLDKGFTGVRGGGDMDWMSHRVPGRDEVAGYEAKINRFIRTNAFTGICLLPARLLSAERIQTMLQNHQFVVTDGKIVPNPYYVPQEQSFKLDLHLVSQMEAWLDWLDAQEPMTSK